VNRREVVTLLGGAAAGWPLAARAQPAGKVFRIGFVGLTTADKSCPNDPKPFGPPCASSGIQEGRNIVIDFPLGGRALRRLPALFAEMVSTQLRCHRHPWDTGSFGRQTGHNDDPDRVCHGRRCRSLGLVTSLARPGGNVTGSTYFIPELSAKQLELLKELIPGLTDVGILLNPANP